MTRKTDAPAAPQTDTAEEAAIGVVTAAAPVPAPAAEPAAAEQPVAGGSYARQADGSLKRVEFTADAPLANEDGAAPSDQKTEG